MVRKDLWTHLLAYNLLRTVMLQSAQSWGQKLSRISLQGTRQQLLQSVGLLAFLAQTESQTLYQMLMEVVAKDLLPLREFRCEPRVVKRRPKSFPRMTQARDALKPALVQLGISSSTI
ncbi:MAG TPA: hypothetical protein VK203_15470 [Nostocaceae cyanobacterium]|nr:hypothetical protein [Nostocaceae cyanobacterium]